MYEYLFGRQFEQINPQPVVLNKTGRVAAPNTEDAEKVVTQTNTRHWLPTCRVSFR